MQGFDSVGKSLGNMNTEELALKAEQLLGEAEQMYVDGFDQLPVAVRMAHLNSQAVAYSILALANRYHDDLAASTQVGLADD